MPENIRYGVTITPPQGEPVTGTYLAEQIESGDYISAVDNNVQFNTNTNNPIISNCTIGSRVLTIELNPSLLNTTIFIRGLIFALGSEGENQTVTFQNNYSVKTPYDSLDYGEHADSTQIDTNFVNTSGTFTISNISGQVGVALNLYPAYNTNELTPENIKEGVTINKIVGTAKSDSYNGTVALVNRKYDSGVSSPAWLSTNNINVTTSNLSSSKPTFAITNNYTSANYCSTGADYNITANSYQETITYSSGSKQISGNYTSMKAIMQATSNRATMFIVSFNA